MCFLDLAGDAMAGMSFGVLLTRRLDDLLTNS